MKNNALIFLLTTAFAPGATIWNGPTISFSKPGFADPLQASSQDLIVPGVAITRGSSAGLYNAAAESSYSSLSPAGTEWAVGTTVDLGSLTFDSWDNIFGLGGPVGGPPNAVGMDFVLHAIADDIYIDVRITSWGQGIVSGGSFSYDRSTAPVPEPAIVAGGLPALGLLVFRRRRAIAC